MNFGSFILCCTLLSSIAAFTLPQDENDNLLSIFMNDGCPCKNGRCVKDNRGKTKCNCKRGYALQDEFTCEKCDCGDKGKCMFLGLSESSGRFKYIKKCLCDLGSAEKDGMCIDCHCGENSKCEFEDEEKICYCIEGYAEKDGVCTECDCGPGGQCTFKNGKQVCTCDEDYVEINRYCLHKCDITTCENGGECKIDDNGMPICECPERFKGTNCETDKCTLITCRNAGVCSIKGGEPLCECPPGYFGKECEIDECSRTTCHNGGKCFMNSGRAVCECLERYEGDRCEIDICTLITCRNGGVCSIKGGKPLCECPPGYFGNECEIDECSRTTCHNGGYCFMNSGRAVCECLERYEGDRCEKDKCSLITCLNGGMCSIREGEPRCKCPQGYFGEECEIDECSKTVCHNGGKCFMNMGKAVCACRERYEGDRCEKDKCDYLDCQNGGQCEIIDFKAYCKCHPKYTGEKCEKPTCSVLYPCQNGGYCNEGTCDCLQGTSGEFCEVIDECPNLCPQRSDINCTYNVKYQKAYCDCLDRNLGFYPDTQECKRTCETLGCKNGGACKEIGVSSFCDCLKGTTGDFCEIIPDCQVMKCGTEATCSYDSKSQKAYCKCDDSDLVFDRDTNTCKKPCRDPSDCLNGGTCVQSLIHDLGHCRCLGQTKGDFCEEIPGCINKDCGDNAQCVFDVEKEIAVCKCVDENFAYDTVDFRCKKTCRDSSDCKNGATCSGGESDRFCRCLNGTEGDSCEDVPGCHNKDCGKDTKCVYDVQRKSESCMCSNRSLAFDEISKVCKKMCRDSSDCKNGATCSGGESDRFCRCLNGTKGDSCEDVPGCNNKDCGKDAKCVYDVQRKSESCKCSNRSLAFDEISKVCKRSCIDDSLCKNDGICMPRGHNRFCHCQDGTSGDYCEEVDICNKLCGKQDGVVCKYDLKQKIAECVCKDEKDVFDVFTKSCKPCDCGGKEISCKVQDGKKICYCPDGYVDENGICKKQFCTEKKCSNGRCEVINDQEVCSCFEGFFLDGDECRRKICTNTLCSNGTCVVRNNGREECICPAGYSLRLGACIRGACRMDTCFGGQCKVIDGELMCVCPERFGLEGIGCFETVCKISRCFGGWCKVIDGEEVCKCHEGYVLENDVCKRILCEKKNCFGGQCHIRNGVEECECPAGHSIVQDVCVRNAFKDKEDTPWNFGFNMETKDTTLKVLGNMT